MSNTTTTAFPKSNDLSSTITSPRGGLNLRSLGASDAPGFAQVLQAFDSSETGKLTENDAEPVTKDEANKQSEATADDAQAESDTEDTQSTDSSDSAGTGTDSNKQTQDSTIDTDSQKIDKDTDHAQKNNPDATQPLDPDTSNLPQSDTPTQNGDVKSDDATQGVATTTKQAVSLEMLVNRGDQAKLSMRGLVQSLRAQSSPDLTTIAVQTRTGQIDQPVQPNPAHPTTPVASNDVTEPDFAPPVPQSIGPAGRNPGDSLSDQPPQSGRGPEHPALRQATPVSVQPHANRTEIDVASVDSQQSRSVRVDAAQPVQPARAQIDFARSGIAAGVSNVATQGQVDGALTERAVSGVDSGVAKDALKPLDPQTPKAGQLTNTQPESVRASVMAQVQRGLASLLRGSNGDMTLKLTPSHLGTVQIQVKRDGDRISLRMTASTEEARDLLRVGSKDLMQTLETKGVKIENFEIDMQPIDLPGDGGASSGFGGERDAAGQQSGQGTTPKNDGENVIPLDERGGQHGINPSESIWSELGLDAIA